MARARLYHYGLTYASTLDLLNVAVQEMHELALSSRETVQICGRDDDHMVVSGMGDHFQVTWSATISFVVPDMKVKQKDPDLIALVKASARSIESQLGWRPRGA